MHVRTSHLVCATPRSGSSLLCEVLASSDVAGHPQEFFWEGFQGHWVSRWGAVDDADYLRCALCEGTTPNGVFGAKIMWAHLDALLEKLRRLPGRDAMSPPDLLSSVFPNLHYIWVVRRDTIRQAVSHLQALQTDVWNDSGEGRTQTPHPVFDVPAIDRLAAEIERHTADWRRFFCRSGIRPHTIQYEYLVLQ